jgi:hypothetical protein
MAMACRYGSPFDADRFHFSPLDPEPRTEAKNVIDRHADPVHLVQDPQGQRGLTGSSDFPLPLY